MPTEVHLPYLVPVCVVVSNDGDGPRIARVVVNDKADLNRGEAYTAAGEPLSHSDPAIVEAKHLVELHPGEADWPAWEFGW
ncbi:MAG TPA: hypothetical protein VGP42_01425 [Stellaceae bacterium]|jgi:hypothetical protein|nr:hypothetical protein [Stellaceae bacterium]